MVVMLRGVVEEAGIAAEGALDHLFERLAFPLAAAQKLVCGLYIGFVVLVMVVFERLARHVGRQRIIRIGEIGKGERHGDFPSLSSAEKLGPWFAPASQARAAPAAKQIPCDIVPGRVMQFA